MSTFIVACGSTAVVFFCIGWFTSAAFLGAGVKNMIRTGELQYRPRG